MRIIFGLREFVIQKHTSTEIGIEESILPKTQIRLVQEYFHLFFIPFFGTDKTWYYNSNGYWFLLKPEHANHILPKYKSRFTPWYKYSGILLLLLIGVGYYIYGLANAINKSKYNENLLLIAKTKYIKEINHLNENTYIGLQNRTDGSISSTLYLKIEKIKDKKLHCYIIYPNKDFNITPLYIDSLYINRKSKLDTISITKQNLFEAIPLKNIEGYNTSNSGILIYEKNYSIIEITEHNKPNLIIGNRSSYSSDGSFMLSFISQLEKCQIVSIENGKSTDINWSIILPFNIPSGNMTNDKDEKNSTFEIRGNNNKLHKSFEFVLKCIYRNNKRINYLVKVDESGYEIEEIYHKSNE
jgi:hypothetical protein